MEHNFTGFSQPHNTRNRENMSSLEDKTNCDDHVPLPGFRFHPTDEELVRFYLRRMVEKRPVRLELIKQIDIYKHDPWELPSVSGNTAYEKELYFYCKRGRKYKNSIRPNRVTGSGFWKATGIDKPVHSHGGEGRDCIGLKKTLVYYRGSAGKGTKTDWMMHEFRLHTNESNDANSKNNPQEAEIWTLCRIFKRNASQRKHSSDSREIHCRHPLIDEGSKADNGDCYINFSLQVMAQNENKTAMNTINEHIDQSDSGQPTSLAQSPSMVSHPSFSSLSMETTDYHWDELRSVVQSALDPSLL